MPVIIDKLLRIGEGKVLRRLEGIAKAVNAIEDDFVAMSDEELRGLTDEYKRRLADGESLDDLEVADRHFALRVHGDMAFTTLPQPDMKRRLDGQLAVWQPALQQCQVGLRDAGTMVFAQQ